MTNQPRYQKRPNPNPGFGPATVETVSAIPLPSRQAPPNPVANDTESLTPAKSKPEPKKKFLDPDDPDAIALRYEKKKRKPKVSGPTGSKNRLKRAITLDDGTLRRQAPIMVRL